MASKLWKVSWGGRLQRRCDELERELSNVRLSLGVAQEHIEAASKQKNEFMSRVAEQIRTPLHGALAVCSTLLKDHGVLGSASSKIEVVRVTTEQVLRTLNELLQIGSSEHSRMCMENVVYDPRKLLDGVIRLASREIDDKQVDVVTLIDARTPATLAGDVSRLRQALSAILETLLDTCKRSGILEVSVKPLHGNDPLLVSMIRSSRYSSFLYELCIPRPNESEPIVVQVGKDPDTEDPALVAMAARIELMGWRMLRCSEGMRYQIVVHAKQSLEGSGASKRYSLSNDLLLQERKLTLLLREESSVYQKTICKQLAEAGHVVDVVRDDREVQRLAREGKLHETYNCILLDTSGPAKSILDTIRAYEGEAAKQRLPIVLLIAQGLDGWRDRWTDAGMDSFLMKPCTKDALLARVGDSISAATALVGLDEESSSDPSMSRSNENAI